MKYTLQVLFSTLFFTCVVACNTVKEAPEEKKVEVVEEEPKGPITAVFSSMPNYKLSFADLTLNMHVNDLDQRIFKHFGEFYTKDFSVYRLDRIDYLAESYYINDIDLFFIDSVLVRIQAFLTVDKANDLINQYGRAKIMINDYHNKKLLETEQILTKAGNRYKINENLNQFTLKWVRENADIEYELNEKPNEDSTSVNKQRFGNMVNPDGYKYKLTFQVKDFDYQLAWVKWESYKESRGLVAQPSDQ